MVFRTDIANERVEEYKKKNNLEKIDGIKVINLKEENVEITRVIIESNEAARLIEKDIGEYVTISYEDIRFLEEAEINVIKKYVVETLKRFIEDAKKKILVVGLGNEEITPDALGGKVAKKIDVTRPLFKYSKEILREDTKEVSAIAPGVLGTTGIETFEIVKSVKDITMPDYIIAIDSLFSQGVKAIGKTIQMSNTGITPGSGVKNKRDKISSETLNTNVISIGAATATDIATIIAETMPIIRQRKNRG